MRTLRYTLSRPARSAGLALSIAAAIALVTLPVSRARAQRISDLPPSALGVRVPALSPAAMAGQRAFDASCASCHGRFGTGSDKGPPLLHDIYNPGHHADEAFFRAARLGVRQHHWRFGDMPPQPKVSSEDVALIVRYLREMQRANGIQYKPHRM